MELQGTAEETFLLSVARPAAKREHTRRPCFFLSWYLYYEISSGNSTNKNKRSLAIKILQHDKQISEHPFQAR